MASLDVYCLTSFMEVTFIPYLQLTIMLSIDVLFVLDGYSHLRVLADRITFLLLYFVSFFGGGAAN